MPHTLEQTLNFEPKNTPYLPLQTSCILWGFWREMSVKRVFLHENCKIFAHDPCPCYVFACNTLEYHEYDKLPCINLLGPCHAMWHHAYLVPTCYLKQCWLFVKFKFKHLDCLLYIQCVWNTSMQQRNPSNKLKKYDITWIKAQLFSLRKCIHRCYIVHFVQCPGLIILWSEKNVSASIAIIGAVFHNVLVNDTVQNPWCMKIILGKWSNRPGNLNDSVLLTQNAMVSCKISSPSVE